MTWISKSLTLDLLAIGIDCMQRTFDRIKAEPDTTPGQWPPVEPSEPPQVEAPAVQPQPEPQQVEEPAPDVAELMPQAQALLRSISLDEGPDWITGVLFPKFGVSTLTAVQGGDLARLIADAQAHINEKQAA